MTTIPPLQLRDYEIRSNSVDSMIKHNECMFAAYMLVMQANGHCENSESNRIAELEAQ